MLTCQPKRSLLNERKEEKKQEYLQHCINSEKKIKCLHLNDGFVQIARTKRREGRRGKREREETIIFQEFTGIYSSV